MHVEAVTMRNFMRHVDTTIVIPASGVIAITGENGHGKSSLVEAVSVALWDTTLRGTSPWAAPDASAYACVRVGETRLHVTRSRKKGKTSLSFHAEGVEPTEYENMTKAQMALELIVGEQEVWRRASVFSSADTLGFATSTDGDRKRMFESVMGVVRFDDGLKKCRADLSMAEAGLASCSADARVANEKLAAAKQRVVDADAATGTADAPDDDDLAVLDAHAEKLRSMLAASDKDISALRARVRDADRAGGEYVALAAQIAASLARIKGAKCPTCAQAIPPEYRARLEKDVLAAQAKAKAETARAKTGASGLEGELTELTDERNALAAQVSTALSKATSARDNARRGAILAKQRGEAAVQVEQQTRAVEVTAAKLAEQTGRVGVLKACERVLGLKGVRAQVVARALGGLEAVANTWLTRISGSGMQVRLAPYTETKTAGLNDKIAFEVEGAANGNGYKGASGGERRRLDVAMMLALGEFVAASNARETGTIFADEVFDALDEDGRSRVVDVLHELADGRAVLVVTHSNELLSELGADAHWTFKMGKVEAA